MLILQWRWWTKWSAESLLARDLLRYLIQNRILYPN
jgi:hypothetical protein